MQGEISKPQSYDLINLRKSIYAPKKAEVRLGRPEEGYAIRNMMHGIARCLLRTIKKVLIKKV